MTTQKTYQVDGSQLLEVKEPTTPFGSYTYADYFSWKIKERVELIKGKIFKMSPAPTLYHQRVSIYISSKIFNFLEGKNCDVFSAPFDVRFVDTTIEDKDIVTVLQPDICVVCDPSKLDAKGCIGAPDLVVEILSPSTSNKDLKDKYEVYEYHKVKEYWVIHPTEHTLMIFTLDDNNKYQASSFYTKGDFVKSQVLVGFELDLTALFNY